MQPRAALGLVFAGLAAAAAALFGTVLWIVVRQGAAGPGAAADIAVILGGAAVLGLSGLFAVAWAFLGIRLVRPLTALSRQILTLAQSTSEGAVEPPPGHLLGPLPEAVGQLSRELVAARREIVKAMATATQRVDEQMQRLEAILLDLNEGVLVCNPEHRILLYNQAAARMLRAPEKVGLSRPLFDLLAAGPILHALERLESRQGADPALGPTEPDVALVSATADGRALLRGRMALIPGPGEGAAGYVLSLTDIGEEITELDRLRAAVDNLQRPAANLRAAAETLAERAGLAEDERRALERAIVDESAALSERLAHLNMAHELPFADRWLMTEVPSAELLGAVARRVADAGGPAVVLTGLPHRLLGESHALTLVLERLIRALGEEAGLESVDLECRLGNGRAYIDIGWPGTALSGKLLEGWLDAPLEGALLGESAREVLRHHDAEAWSQALGPGQAALRIALKAAPHAPPAEPEEAAPPRPEFYDFDLMRLPAAGGALADRPLGELTYVVFDTETTGLKPSAGDEMVAIAGVRIVNRRILSGETFSRLINPRRPIPQASIRFHGITEDMVADKPPIQVVLPQFHAFVADSVLVAHNAAFDMRFLALKQADSGLVFDNPVLDTLLLSVYLHADAVDHGLDAIAARFGVDVIDRHTALGDALVTADIFVHMIELLESRGVRTLGEAVAASGEIIEIRRRQAEF